MSAIHFFQNCLDQEIARIHQLEESQRPLSIQLFSGERDRVFNPKWISPRERELIALKDRLLTDMNAQASTGFSAPRLFFYESILTGLTLEKQLDEIESIPGPPESLNPLRRQLSDLRSAPIPKEFSEIDVTERVQTFQSIARDIQLTALKRTIDARVQLYDIMARPVGIVDRITNAAIGLTVFADTYQSDAKSDFLRMKAEYKKAAALIETGDISGAHSAFLAIENDPAIPGMKKDYEFADAFQTYGVNTALILASSLSAGWASGLLGFSGAFAAESLTTTGTLLSLGTRSTAFVLTHHVLENLVTGVPSEQSLGTLAEEILLTAGMFEFIGQGGKLFQKTANHYLIGAAQLRLLSAGSPISPELLANEMKVLADSYLAASAVGGGNFLTQMTAFSAWENIHYNYELMKQGKFAPVHTLHETMSPQALTQRALGLMALQGGHAIASPLVNATTKAMENFGQVIRPMQWPWETGSDVYGLAPLGPSAVPFPNREEGPARPLLMSGKKDNENPPKPGLPAGFNLVMEDMIRQADLAKKLELLRTLIEYGYERASGAQRTESFITAIKILATLSLNGNSIFRQDTVAITVDLMERVHLTRQLPQFAPVLKEIFSHFSKDEDYVVRRTATNGLDTLLKLTENPGSIYSPAEITHSSQGLSAEEVLQNNRATLNNWEETTPVLYFPNSLRTTLISESGVKKIQLHFNAQGELSAVSNSPSAKPSSLTGVWVTGLLGPHNQLLWFDSKSLNKAESSHQWAQAAIDDLYNQSAFLRRRYLSEHQVAIDYFLFQMGEKPPASSMGVAAQDLIDIVESAGDGARVKIWCYHDAHGYFRLKDESLEKGKESGSFTLDMEQPGQFSITSSQLKHEGDLETLRRLIQYVLKRPQATQPFSTHSPQTLEPKKSHKPSLWQPSSPYFRWNEQKGLWTFRFPYGANTIELTSRDFELKDTSKKMDTILVLQQFKNHVLVTPIDSNIVVRSGDDNVLTIVRQKTKIFPGDRIQLGKGVEFLVEEAP